MNKFLGFTLIMFLAFSMVSCGNGNKVVNRSITAPDAYGLNETARQFHGSYFDNYSGRPPYEYDAWASYDGDDDAYLANNPGADNHWAWPYRDVDLLMKWNKDWPEEGGWLTNHQWGSYEEDGETYNWDYFVKIVWVGPTPDGEDPYAETRIWGQFAIIQGVYNDQGTGEHGNVPIPGPNGFGAH